MDSPPSQWIPYRPKLVLNKLPITMSFPLIPEAYEMVESAATALSGTGSRQIAQNVLEAEIANDLYHGAKHLGKNMVRSMMKAYSKKPNLAASLGAPMPTIGAPVSISAPITRGFPRKRRGRRGRQFPKYGPRRYTPREGHIVDRTDSIALEATVKNEFTIWRFHMNPGAHESFPQLAPIARSFAKYTMHPYVEYSPHCATSSSGGIAMSWSPNPNDPPPASLQEMSEHEYFHTGSVWSPFKVSLPRTKEEKLVRDEGSYGGAPTAELEPYDHGVLYVATYGGSASLTNVGVLEIGATYDLHQFEPSDPEFLEFNATTGISNSATFGGAGQMTFTGDIAINNLDKDGAYSAGGLFFREPGRYNVLLRWIADTATAGSITANNGLIVHDSYFTADHSVAGAGITLKLLITVPITAAPNGNPPRLGVSFSVLSNPTYVHGEASPAPIWQNIA